MIVQIDKSFWNISKINEWIEILNIALGTKYFPNNSCMKRQFHYVGKCFSLSSFYNT
jgi:hypothetical protein